MTDATDRYLQLRDAAGCHHGALHVCELARLGFNSSAIAHAVERGRLTRVYPEVYAVGHGALGVSGWHRAAVLRAGPGSAIGHHTAGVEWEMSRFPAGSVHVVTPRQVRPTPGLTLHRSSSLSVEHITAIEGVPYTSRARTIVDLGTALTAPQLANVLYRAAYHQPGIGEAVHQLLAALPRVPGRATVVRALALHDAGSAGTRSMLEDRFLQLLQRARIHLGEHNVSAGVGELAFEVDHIWRAALLVVEVDGFGHRRMRASRIDAERTAALEAHGFMLLRFTARDIRTRPMWVTTKIRRALDARRNRRRRLAHSASH